MIKPRKAFGQNFLYSSGVLDKISTCISSEQVSAWLEIGCGTGLLTERLLRTDLPFVGVELDTRLMPILQDKFLSSPQKEKANCPLFINASFLDITEPELNLPSGYGIAANLPYYLTTPIIEQILQSFEHWQVCYFMVQKEFGERLVAAHGSRTFGRLSLFCSYYAEVSKVLTVKRGSFFPVPGVDSVFVKLKKKPVVLRKNEELCFFNLVRQAFSQRRKIARNLLKEHYNPVHLDLSFQKLEINLRSRAEEISLVQWLELSRLLCCADMKQELLV